MLHRLLLTLFLLCSPLVAQAAPAAARLEPHALFSDHMVLQCERPARVWGSAEPGERIEIALVAEDDSAGLGESFAGTVTGEDGLWSAWLGPQPPGGPFVLRIRGSEEIVLRDVWLGEVWICSGQSNMEWPVRAARDPETEIAAAGHSRIRLFQVPRLAAAEPAGTIEAAWQVCSPATVPNFSAVGYYFGRSLREQIDRPVGLIQTAWGGTPAEAWTTPAYLAAEPSFAPILEREPRHESWAPSALYHGMIAPLTRYAIRGAIWYQGESNADRAWQYRELFPAMIRSWREAFGQGDFPFLFVQLANFKHSPADPAESDWAELREAQAAALALPRTGMAVAIDIGNPDDIHPRNKQEVGRRLALAALPAAYGREALTSGPRLRWMDIRSEKVILHFSAAGASLGTSDGAGPRGFAVAGRDRVFHWAQAEIEGRTVVLWSPEVGEPAAARYAWADNPDANLVNSAGLPAAPFRTDAWPG